MEITEISNEIKKRIDMLSKSRKILSERAENKALAVSNYDKALAVTIIDIKNKTSITFEGEEISVNKLPANLLEKIAKGMCWKEKLEMEKAEGLYKAAVSGISSLESELNGYQSIFRYLKHD